MRCLVAVWRAPTAMLRFRRAAVIVQWRLRPWPTDSAHSIHQGTAGLALGNLALEVE